MNNYFVMTLDNRALKDKKIQLEDRRFLKEEPFVSYLNFDKGEKLPDFIQGKCENQTFFCISQAMKDIFDAYVSFQKEIPVFFTDSQYHHHQFRRCPSPPPLPRHHQSSPWHRLSSLRR